jgi:hypothetical protein
MAIADLVFLIVWYVGTSIVALLIAFRFIPSLTRL